METVRITKVFEFEMAHALYHHDRKCKYIHGHSYKLAVTIIGTPMHEEGAPHDGMLIDFGAFKELMNDEIISQFDHALLINANAPYTEMKNIELFDNTMVVPYQPTCENIILDFAERIKNKLPGRVKLFSLKLHETSTSFVEWFADENEL